MFCLLTDCDAVNRFVAMYWEINFISNPIKGNHSSFPHIFTIITQYVYYASSDVVVFFGLDFILNVIFDVESSYLTLIF